MEPDSRLLSAEMSEHLHGAIAELPEDERILVRLHVLEEWPMDFLSQAMAKTRASCDGTLQSALSRLRLRLGRIFS